MSNEITLKSYAKINLSLDIIGRRPNGYHNISSLMQDISLYDIVTVNKCSESGTIYKPFHCRIGSIDVHLCTNIETIPLDEGNLAIKGARVIIQALEEIGALEKSGIRDISIFIDKQLPVAAGIAGGSGNAAVAMLGINQLAGAPLALRELMDIGVKVGADVPFSMMMNAWGNKAVLGDMPGIEEARGSAWVSGIGEVVEPTDPIHRFVIMANPGISVSTREAYEAIDAIADYQSEKGLFTNQLEKYTLAAYGEAAELKSAMQEGLEADCVLMSGSGPTMVAYYRSEEAARADFMKMENADWCKAGWRVWFAECGCE